MGRVYRAVLAFAWAGVTAGACGGTDPGRAAVAHAGRQLRAAGEAGAREDPVASSYLDLAMHELDGARARLQAGDGEGARSLAARAEADAELAAMAAIEASTRGAVERTEDAARALLRAGEGGR
jgi:hypothetical protein